MALHGIVENQSSPARFDRRILAAPDPVVDLRAALAGRFFDLPNRERKRFDAIGLGRNKGKFVAGRHDVLRGGQSHTLTRPRVVG